MFCRYARWIPVLALFCLPVLASESTPGEKPVIQVALLLDTSSSMGGLLRQAKTQLWSVVNEFALARRGEVRPDFQVALYEYGNKTLPASRGFVRQVSPLTDNLDKISVELSALKIMSHGSNEYAGWAIRSAFEELAWSPLNSDLRVILIAGNESFAQGPVDYRATCRAAIGRGIIVDTIFCGSHDEGVQLHWKDGAVQAEGMYSSIDQNLAPTPAVTSRDKELLRLGSELNKTYLPFGKKGKAGKERQKAADRSGIPGLGAEADRVISKGSRLYRNSSWDLVDAINEKKVKLEDRENADLPQEMRAMSLEEKRAHVKKMAAKRDEIRKSISDENTPSRIRSASWAWIVSSHFDIAIPTPLCAMR